MRRSTIIIACLVALAPAAAAAGTPFYLPAGDLVPGSGEGAADETVYSPGMRYPIQDAPSYPNSQVWGNGGLYGPGGSQCDAANFSYPWRDNYCEERSWDMPLCPAGTGHQGQDIRAATCDAMEYPIVSAQDGTVTSIGSYSVYVTASDGTRYDYLHGGGIAVGEGDALSKGDVIGLVSNEFGGESTTVHLHFNIRQDVAGVGFVYVSPYMSLVRAYEELTGMGNEPPAGPIDAVGCTAITGWAQDPDAPESPVEIQAWFGGPSGDPNAVGITVLADLTREDLCDTLGSCDHGFEIAIPRSLEDGSPHEVYVYAVDTDGGEAPQLDASPGTISCPPPAVPAGVRRRISGPEAVASWAFSTFWDLATIDDAALADIPEGDALGDAPLIVRGEDDPEDALWLIDAGRKRSFADAAVRERWRVAVGDAVVWPQDSVDGVPEGTAMRDDVFLVAGSDGVMYLVDDAQCPADEECGGSASDGEGDGGDDGTAAGDDADADDGGTDGGEASLPGAAEGSGGGCGCTTDHGPRGLVGAFAGIVVLALRRRRSRGAG
jgi:murein DD-endopeptidase MepM/ murein hydrolase activator NlpD